MAHPPREEGFQFTGQEVITAAELQLESVGGIEDTAFVTVMVSLTKDNAVTVEGFQVSLQCMEMVAEGVLSPSSNLGSCAVNESYTAIIEAKETKEVIIH